GLVNGHGHRVGQVQAAAAGAHRQAYALLGRQGVTHFFGQATAFRSEQKGIAGLVGDLVEGLRPLGGEGKQAWLAKGLETALQVGMALERGVFVIVQTGAAQALVVQFEAQWFDQVQLATAVGAQPDNVAGIGRNFRLKEDDVEHAALRALGRAPFYAARRPAAAFALAFYGVGGADRLSRRRDAGTSVRTAAPAYRGGRTLGAGAATLVQP